MSGDYRNLDRNVMRAVEFDLSSCFTGISSTLSFPLEQRTHAHANLQTAWSFHTLPTAMYHVCVCYRCAVTVFNLCQAVAICLVFLGIAGHEVYRVTYLLVSASDDMTTDRSQFIHDAQNDSLDWLTTHLAQGSISLVSSGLNNNHWGLSKRW